MMPGKNNHELHVNRTLIYRIVYRKHRLIVKHETHAYISVQSVIEFLTYPKP